MKKTTLKSCTRRRKSHIFLLTLFIIYKMHLSPHLLATSSGSDSLNSHPSPKQQTIIHFSIFSFIFIKEMKNYNHATKTHIFVCMKCNIFLPRRSWFIWRTAPFCLIVFVCICICTVLLVLAVKVEQVF